jgi:2-polyprenyl-3-methyl-5-hydroxy-6-metoxy-1,4-benzoquinol methylase
VCGATKARLVIANAGYSMLSCEACGFRMEHPLPRPEDDEQLYGDEFYEERGLEIGLDAQNPIMRGLLDERVRLLTDLNGGPGSVLDIGAGTGLFVEASTRAGWRASGIETSDSAVRIAARLGTASVKHGRLEDVSVQDRYDAVTLWDVLEHMPDPRAALLTIRELLREKGLVAISLPNVAGMKARALGVRWRYYRREFGHISHFSPATLVMLLAQAGFTTVLVRTSGAFNLGKPFHLDPVDVATNHRMLRRLQSIADGAAGRMGLGEDLNVIARRSS